MLGAPNLLVDDITKSVGSEYNSLVPGILVPIYVTVIVNRPIHVLIGEIKNAHRGDILELWKPQVPVDYYAHSHLHEARLGDPPTFQ
jgi:hypothetical protein